jgi:hypothetical protein
MDENKKQFWLKWDNIEDEEEKLEFIKTIPSLKNVDEKTLKKFVKILNHAIEINQQANFY